MKEQPVDLTVFKKLQDELVATDERSWNRYYTKRAHAVRDYKPEEIDKIINSGDVVAQQALSRAFFERKSLYKRILYYYATLLTYQGLLIPNPSFGKQLSTPHIAKRYYSSLDYLDKLNLQETLTRISLKVLIDGSYYGIIKKLDKEMEEVNVGNKPNSDVSTYFDYSTTPEIVKSEDEYIGLQHRRLQHVNGEGADNYEWDWF